MPDHFCFTMREVAVQASSTVPRTFSTAAQ